MPIAKQQKWGNILNDLTDLERFTQKNERWAAMIQRFEDDADEDTEGEEWPKDPIWDEHAEYVPHPHGKFVNIGGDMVEQQGHYEDRGDPFKSVSMHMSDHVRDGGETSTAPGKNCEADIADKACVVAILRDRSCNRCHETLFVNPYFSKAFLIGSSYQLNQIDQEQTPENHVYRSLLFG